MFTENDFTRICCDSRTGYPHSPKCLQREVTPVGKHSTPKGEYSTLGKPNGAPYDDPNYEPKHAVKEGQGSDLPSRDGQTKPGSRG